MPRPATDAYPTLGLNLDSNSFKMSENRGKSDVNLDLGVRGGLKGCFMMITRQEVKCGSRVGSTRV